MNIAGTPNAPIQDASSGQLLFSPFDFVPPDYPGHPLNATGSLPFNACDMVCNEQPKAFYDATKDNKLVVTVTAGFCDTVKGRIRIRHFELSLGFLPEIVADPNAMRPVDGFWTKNLFPGAKDFHLPPGFDIPITIGGTTYPQGYMPPFDNVDNDTTSGVAVAVEASGCPKAAIAIPPFVAGVCDLVSGGPHDCNLRFAGAIAERLATLVPNAVGGVAAELINPFFNYAGVVPNVPSNSTGLPDCKGGCSGDDLKTLASASVTYQKFDWFMSAFGTYANGGWMDLKSIDSQTPLDENMNPIPYIANLTFNYDNDADKDGVLTPDDDCPFNYDPKQGDPNHPVIEFYQGQDTDCDGIADACDPCPRDPRNDEDHDGKCADVDNCPRVFNPDQANANKVDEDAHLTASPIANYCQPLPMPVEVGDGCDPVPTPRATIVPKSETHKLGPLTCGSSLYNEMDMLPLRSHSFTIPPYSAAVHDVPTAPRYCQTDPLKHIDCSKMPTISDPLFDNKGCAPPDLCDKPETGLDSYHRVTYVLSTIGTHGVLTPAPGLVEPNDPAPLLQYEHTYDETADGTSYDLKWDLQADVARWNASGLIGPLRTGTNLSDPTTLIGTDLKGAFWLHAVTPIGSAVTATVVTPFNQVQIGVRENLGETGQLANVHMLNYQARSYSCGLPDAFVHPPVRLPFYFLWKVIPDPGPDAFVRWDSQPGETNVIVPFGTNWGALDNTGGAVDVTNRMGPALLTRLADPTLVWANAVEPFAVQGAGAGFPLAVALSATGHQIVDTMTTNGAKLLADGDLGAARPTLIGSPHANGFAAVLSRARGGVFVVGGVNPETQAPTGQVWFAPLNGTRWSPVPVGIRPAQVVAASYSFANDSLYVLDMLPDPQNPQVAKARLWTHDMRHDSSRVIAMSPHNPDWDAQSLVIDRDGAVLLVSSSTTLGQSTIARLEVLGDKADEVTGVIQSPRPLLMPPVVDQAGYSITAQGRPGWPDEAVVAIESVKLREDSQVNGSVGVINGPAGECKKKKDADNDGDHNDDDDCAAAHTNAVLDEGAQIHGDLRAGSVRLHEHAIIDGNLGYNSLSGGGTVTGVLNTPLSLPLPIALPAPAAGAAGSAPVTVAAGGAITLAAGGYGDAGVKENGVLSLSGGSYQFASLEVAEGATLQCQERCEILITGRLKTHEHSFFGAAENTMFDAADVVVTVLGKVNDNDDARPQRVGARFGEESTVRARVFLPDSTLAFGEKLAAKGTFVAARIRIGEKARVEKDEPAVARKLVPTLAFAPATIADLGAIL